jgi:hypothetical protein
MDAADHFEYALIILESFFCFSFVQDCSSREDLVVELLDLQSQRLRDSDKANRVVSIASVLVSS